MNQFRFWRLILLCTAGSLPVSVSFIMWWQVNLTGKWQGSRVGQVWGPVGGKAWCTCQYHLSVGNMEVFEMVWPHKAALCRDPTQCSVCCLCDFVLVHSVCVYNLPACSFSSSNPAGFFGPGPLYSGRGGWITWQSFGKSSRVSRCLP